jgi:isochorismate pyruvate lyase
MRFEFKKIDYIMVMVENMNRTIEFYRDVLGLPIKFESESWTEFQSGPTTLALHGGGKPRVEEPLSAPHRETAGTSSIGFNVDDLEATYNYLQTKGVRFTLPPTSRQNEGILLAIALDPDGLEISFSQPLNKESHQAGMTTKIHRTYSGSPWEAKVGYCRAIRAGNTIAVTGTISLNDQGKIHAPGDPYQQSKRCLEIIEGALAKLGAKRENIIRTRLFVTDIKFWQDFGRAHGEFFADHPPATSMIEIKSLIDSSALIEIEADAIVG